MRSRTLSLVLVLAFASAPCVAAEQGVAAVAKRPAVVDVALRTDGVLIGQLVKQNGSPLAEAEVKLQTAEGVEATAQTNHEGAFAFRGVKGVVTLQSERTQSVVRGWAPGTAPPKATSAVLMVSGDGVARGQQYAGPRAQGLISKSKTLFSNPLFVAGVVGTAVAIPVAIANDDDDPAS